MNEYIYYRIEGDPELKMLDVKNVEMIYIKKEGPIYVLYIKRPKPCEDNELFLFDDDLAAIMKIKSDVILEMKNIIIDDLMAAIRFSGIFVIKLQHWLEVAKESLEKKEKQEETVGFAE